MKSSRILRLAPLLALAAPLGAQIAIVDSGAVGNQVNLSGTYAQNFDTLPIPPQGGTNWINNSTLPGWYSNQSYLLSNSTNGGLASYGTDSDRALGSTGAYWALRFVNSSSQTITGLSLSYDVEQWYRAANSPQVSNRLHLYYIIYPSSMAPNFEVGNLLGPGWTHVDAATLATPNASQTGATSLDGNLAENRGNVSIMISGITLAPGEKLWLEWVTGDDPGNDHALAIDNLSVSFSTIPEPSSATALLGLAALAFATRRRNRS